MNYIERYFKRKNKLEIKMHKIFIDKHNNKIKIFNSNTIKNLFH